MGLKPAPEQWEGRKSKLNAWIPTTKSKKPSASFGVALEPETHSFSPSVVPKLYRTPRTHSSGVSRLFLSSLSVNTTPLGRTDPPGDYRGIASEAEKLEAQLGNN